MPTTSGIFYSEGAIILTYVAGQNPLKMVMRLFTAPTTISVDDNPTGSYTEPNAVGYSGVIVTSANLSPSPGLPLRWIQLSGVSWTIGPVISGGSTIYGWFIEVDAVFPNRQTSIYGGLFDTPITILPTGTFVEFTNLMLELHDCGTSPPPPPPPMQTGTISAFAGSSTPATGFLVCDGSAVSRTTYSGLFGVISTTWGIGDGVTTFNLPDLRDRTVIGTSPGSLSGNRPTARTLAQTGGEEAHTQVTTELATHTHTVNDPSHQHTSPDGLDYLTASGGFSDGPLGNVRVGDSGSPLTGFSPTGITISNQGSSAAMNVMQPFGVIIWLIAT